MFEQDANSLDETSVLFLQTVYLTVIITIIFKSYHTFSIII